MSYTKNYTGSKDERMKEAYRDAIDYLGDRFPKIANALLDMAYDCRTIRDFVRIYPLFLSFAGLQGAPARAMALRTIRCYNANIRSR